LVLIRLQNFAKVCDRSHTVSEIQFQIKQNKAKLSGSHRISLVHGVIESQRAAEQSIFLLCEKVLTSD